MAEEGERRRDPEAPGHRQPDLEAAGVLNGFLTGIDPHTLVFSPEDFKDFSVHIEGEICGVGMYVGTRDGKLTVIEVLKKTPAAKAGFKKGDTIA